MDIMISSEDGSAMDPHQPPSPRERLIITAGREIHDGELVMVGTYWPIPASLFAKRCHARECILIFEGGLICTHAPPRIPLIASDPAIINGACLAGDVFDTMGAVLHAGLADVALLSAHSVDLYGNINTTCLGTYNRPTVRLAGSGGACDFGCLARRLLIILEHDVRRFPERVDFVTTPGHLSGGQSRREAGLPEDTGPHLIISDLGIFGFDPETREAILERIHEGVDPEDVKCAVRWPLKVSPHLELIPPPTEEELRILREEVDPHGMFLRDARVVP
jgi:glutaconate CoA-transferase subunit B